MKEPRLTGVLASILLWVALTPASSQEFVLSPDQFKEDQTGHGAVLCVWGFYFELQQWSAACGRPRTGFDDAIDKAVLRIEDFIVANSSLKPDHAMLERFKAREQKSLNMKVAKDGLKKTCMRDDLDMVRSTPPEKLDDGVKALLSVPREPVMNPCL